MAPGVCYTAAVPYERDRLPQTPAQAPGPIAWETPDSSFVRRLVGTLASTFLPLTTIRAVSTGNIAPALRFTMLCTLPWMPLWAIPPFTHSLIFKDSFTVAAIRNAGISVEWDVLRAMGIGVVLSGIGIVSWALPFASLLRAYGKPPEPGVSSSQAAWRLVLYRAWVVPCGLSLLAVLAWSMPVEPNQLLIEMSLLGLHLLPRMLILIHCFAMARYFGVEGFASIVVSVVPLIVEVSVGMVVGHGAEKLLPVLPGGR